MSKPITNFFGITNCFLKKEPYPNDETIEKNTVQWMCNNQISCFEPLTQLAHELSKVKITNKEYFDFCYFGIPKITSFIKYNAVKSKKDQEIKWISEYFSISLEQAKQYFLLLPEEEKVKIFEFFTNRGIKK